jgi:hypothetical protein
MARAFQLLLIDLRAVLHRTRHDLGKELSVLVASLILLATFGYVFDDFLNVQIASLSSAMRDKVAQVAASATLAVSALAAARALRREAASKASTRRMAEELGEEPRIVRAYVVLRGAAVIAIWHGLAWTLTHRFLIRCELAVALAGEAAMIAVALAGVALPARREPPLAAARPERERGSGTTRRRALLAWRLRQHVLRNRAHQAIYALALAFALLGAAVYGGGAPLVAPVAAAFVAGVLIATILALALAEDLQHAWVERALGVSHDEIVLAYFHVAVVLAGPAAALTALLLGLSAPAGEALSEALKPAAVLLVTPLFAPYVLFQIDARRPGVNVMGLIIVGLFLGTAIFAHWLAVVVPLIAKAAIAGNQAGRFHRA